MAHKQLYSNLKKVRTYNNIVDLYKKLTFGKFKGKTPFDIILQGKEEYLIWLHNNNIYYEFSTELKTVLKIK